MQKKIGYLNIESSQMNWLLEHLPAGELREGLKKLNDGEYSTLMLESDVEGSGFLPSYEIRAGKLVINEKSRKVLLDENEIALTPKEFDILFFLAKNKGEVFTKEQIYKAVWDEDYVMDDSNIMAFIRKLRKKIEPNPDAPEYILTIWGIGYKFNENI